MHGAINAEMTRQREARTNRQQVALRATKRRGARRLKRTIAPSNGSPRMGRRSRPGSRLLVTARLAHQGSQPHDPHHLPGPPVSPCRPQGGRVPARCRARGPPPGGTGRRATHEALPADGPRHPLGRCFPRPAGRSVPPPLARPTPDDPWRRALGQARRPRGIAPPSRRRRRHPPPAGSSRSRS